MVAYPKGVSMEDGSQLAERIIDQVADAVIYASRSGVIIHGRRVAQHHQLLLARPDNECGGQGHR
jgi:hypothetical protein